MPGQFLPLRLLGSSSALLVSPRRGITVLTRAFPFKLKYAALSPGQPPPVPNWAAGAPPRGARPFSGRSAGGRGGGGLRDSRRGGFRGAAGQGRSLVDDEAELSNWVSDLKTDSFRFGSSSDGEDAGSYARGKAKGRERGRGRDGYRGRGRDGRSSFGARFGSESDDAGEFAGARTGSGGRSRGRGGDRGRIGDRRDRGREPMPSSRGYGMSSVGERDSDSGDSNSFLERRRGRGSDRPLAGSRGSRSREPMPSRRGYGMSSVGERDSDSGDFNSFSERRRGRGSDRPLRGSREMVSGSDLNGKVEDVDFGGRKRGRGGIGGMTSPSSLAKRGRKGSEPSGSRSGGGRLSFEISDEQESEDDDDDDEEEEEDEEDEDEDVSVSEDGFFGKVEDREERVVPDAYDRMSLSKEKGDAPSRPSTSEGAESYLSQTRFDQCSVSPLSLKGIKAAGYERMTMVQEATLPIILKGNDVLAKAKTGTGKTVAFLLPAIEVITKSPPVDRDQKRPPIIVLVICPTRELANQAATEANTLLKFHPSIGVQVVIGGTRLALEQKNMQANPCQILVATPGRLKDHIENTPGFATRLKGVKVLVLDEADHLLDMGFRKDIENIIAAVPKQRQTLLFSATVPDEVRQICHIALKRDHEFVNTVEDGSEETHSQVKQWVLVAPLEKHFSMLYGILTDHISENIDYKVLVFCTTAMVTRLVAGLLAELNLNVREIHSRKPQSYRTRVSDEFRKSKGLILVTSDVSARGVDYPDVTLVIQVGVPADREQYIHRLGRTGRKGKEGKGILLLAPWEESFLSGIKDLPISEAPVPLVDPDTRKKVERALSHVEMKNKESAYQSWLGYYNSNKSIGRDKARLVVLANEFSRSMGLDDPPALSKLVVGKMGLRNVPGLRTK